MLRGNRRKLLQKLNEYAHTSYKPYSGTICWATTKRDTYPSKWFDEYIDCTFEGYTFPLFKDYDKIKANLEKSEKKITSGIDKLISDMNKAENDLIKNNRDENKKPAPADSSNVQAGERDTTKINKNEAIVQVSSIYQTVWGFIKECEIQFFSAQLQAVKDACSQAKEIAVKVIGLSKKMTESTDYSSYNESSTFGGDFISAVKLV